MFKFYDDANKDDFTNTKYMYLSLSFYVRMIKKNNLDTTST